MDTGLDKGGMDTGPGAHGARVPEVGLRLRGEAEGGEGTHAAAPRPARAPPAPADFAGRDAFLARRRAPGGPRLPGFRDGAEWRRDARLPSRGHAHRGAHERS